MTLRRWTASKRLKAGDGRELQRFRWWQMPLRSLFWLRLPGAGCQDRQHIAVDVRHWSRLSDGKARAHLFLDGRHAFESRLPAVFPVEDGVVEVAMSNYGIKRCHYCPSAGQPLQLTPDPASAQGRRARFGARRPGLSRGIGAVSTLLLLAGLGLNLLQLAGPLSEVPPIAERFGTFESPVRLPIWLNIALGGGAVLASMERALRLRYSLLDTAGR